MPESDFKQRLFRALDWPLDYVPNKREANIIRHYIHETDVAHMTDNTALERCVGDIQGWNWHPETSYGNRGRSTS